MLADVLALLAGANQINHATADGMFGDIARVAYLRESANVAGARSIYNLPPVGMIGLGELREEPFQRAVCGVLDLIGQHDTVRLLPSAEKDLRTAHDVAEQFLYPVTGNFQVGLDGLTCLDGFRCSCRAVGVER